MPGRTRRHYALTLAGLMLAALLFRLPLLLNVGDLNSDNAVVGLQARHMLHGEFSAFLWGAPYQSSLDALVAAGFFSVLGPTPLALSLGTLLGFVVMLALGFDTLARRVGALSAGVSCLVWAFVPRVLSVLSVFPPRQWCLTAVVGAIWLLDRASTSRKPTRFLVLGLTLAGFAVYLDFFALQLIPGLGLLALWHAWGERTERAQRLGAVAFGTLAAAAIFFSAHPHYFTEEKPVGVLWNLFSRNGSLFLRECLPALLSYGVPTQTRPGGPWTTWQPDAAFQVVQWLGAGTFVLVVLVGVAFVFSQRASLSTRGLALMAAAGIVACIAAFQVSGMVSDVWSGRYLIPLLLLAPYALAPLAERLGAKRLGMVLGVYLLSALVGGWVGHGAYTQGLRPVVTRSATGVDEAELARVLRAKHVSAALAQYWLSYRDAFLLGEDPIFVPLFGTRWDNRYPAYWERVKTAPVVAYVFHPSAAGPSADEVERELVSQHASYQRTQTTGGFTVLVLTRAQP